MTADPTARFATPRIAAGALFLKGDFVLLVRKSYGEIWDIPGGYAEHGESPAAACEREIQEELSLRRTVRRLLVNDWAPNDTEGDKVLYIFDCGPLGTDEDLMHPDGEEILGTSWVARDDICDRVIPRLARRLLSACAAHDSGEALYLENGHPSRASDGQPS